MRYPQAEPLSKPGWATRRARAAILGLAAALLMTLAAGAPASAAEGECGGGGSTGKMCLYFDSTPDRGAEWGTNSSTPSLYVPYMRYFRVGPYGANGSGWEVWNKAASGWNRDTNSSARVYFNSNYGGSWDSFCPSTSKNLYSTYKDNASVRVGQIPTGCPI